MDLESDGFFLSLAVCASTPVVIGLCWLFAWLRRGMPVGEYLGLVPVSARRMFRWCLVLLVFVVVSDGLTASLGRTIVPEVMVDAYRTAWFEPLLWLAIILLAPLSEEVLFRGFLYRGLEQSKVGVWGAIGISALLWAIIHVQYDLYGMATIFAGGILLGVVRQVTGSILPTILLHALMNLIATVQVMVFVRWYGLPDG